MILMLALIGMIVNGILSTHKFHRKQRDRITAEWGQPFEPQEMDADIIEDIAKYWQALQAHGPGHACFVDDTTWNDLDLNLVFSMLNRTESTVGAEALYAMLRNIGADEETLRRRNRLMQALTEDASVRFAIQLRLAGLGKNPFHGAETFLFQESSHPIPHRWLYLLLAAAPVLCFLLGFWSPIFFVSLVLVLFVNTIVHYYQQARWGAALPPIRHLSAVVHCAQLLQKHPLNGVTEKLAPLCAKLKPITRWNAVLAPEAIGDMAGLTEIIRILFQLNMISLIRLSSFVHQHRQQVAVLYSLIGELDALISIASLRASLPVYALPEFTDSLRVEAEEVAHPLLREPVRNSLLWHQNLLITGSNASGKSTFVKAVALNAIFAQSICTCFARRFVLPRSQVMSSMALRDNLQGGDSYFVIEIKSLRRILSSLRKDLPTLCFIDEILRGTNTVERIASSASLLSNLSTQNALCIAATHDIELTRLLPNYEQFHFREEIAPDGMTFSYRLMNGPCTTRNAIRLLEQMTFPSQVVEMADAMAASFDETGKWQISQDPQ